MPKLAKVVTIGLLSSFPLATSCGGSSEGNSGDSNEGMGNAGVTLVDGLPADGQRQGADPNAPPPLAGGGSNSAPLGAGCGPETSGDCHPVGGNCNPGTLAPDHRVVAADSICFYSEAVEEPSAIVEYVTEVQNGREYVHIRVTFDPRFVDTVYGECAYQTGWGGEQAEAPTDAMVDEKKKKAKGGHTFKDLVGSDHVELMLEDCAGDLAMHLKLDFISEDTTSACGYASGGVTSGEGKMLVGSPEYVLAASSSLDRNVNGCGYCEVESSPCPGEDYAGDPDAPAWDYRVVYEVWVDAAAFGTVGFCGVDIDAVHASPAKSDEHTVLVEPDDCPPPPCPPSYQLYLTSEGEQVCVPTGDCPEGYTIDLTSEGESCIPVD